MSDLLGYPTSPHLSSFKHPGFRVRNNFIGLFFTTSLLWHRLTVIVSPPRLFFGSFLRCTPAAMPDDSLALVERLNEPYASV